MTEKNTTKRRLAALALVTVVTSSVPAAAQFFPFFGGNPFPQPPRQHQYQQQPQQRRDSDADYSHAPAAKKPEQPPTSTVAVMGDSMADWLAYGLEEAFADTPEIGMVRKNKPNSGLIRYDSKGDL